MIDVSLYESALGLVAYHLVGYLGSGAVPGRHGTRVPADRALPGVRRQRRRDDDRRRERPPLREALCDVLGAPELTADPRFATNPLASPTAPS